MLNSRSPIILKKRAQKRRKSTGDDRYYSAMEHENLHWAKRYVPLRLSQTDTHCFFFFVHL